VLQSIVTRFVALGIGSVVALLTRFLGKIGLRVTLSPPSIETPDFMYVHAESAPALSAPGMHRNPHSHSRLVDSQKFDLYVEVPSANLSPRSSSAHLADIDLEPHRDFSRSPHALHLPTQRVETHTAEANEPSVSIQRKE
jgi:hypothetical protein